MLRRLSKQSHEVQTAADIVFEAISDSGRHCILNRLRVRGGLTLFEPREMDADKRDWDVWISTSYLRSGGVNFGTHFCGRGAWIDGINIGARPRFRGL